jgi:hypothetical protein
MNNPASKLNFREGINMTQNVKLARLSDWCGNPVSGDGETEAKPPYVPSRKPPDS